MPNVYSHISQHNQDIEYFQHPKKFMTPLQPNPFLPIPAPGKHQLDFCPYSFVFSSIGPQFCL